MRSFLTRIEPDAFLHGLTRPNVLRVASLALTDPRGDDMRTACFLTCRVFLTCVFIGSHLSMVGCTDNAGTMVEESAEFKAHRAAKIGNYKGGPPKASAKVTSKKK
jgi:hypothetical protein